MSRPPETRVADRIEAVVRAARAWRDPEHKVRAGAVARTLAGAPNRFTEESLAFAVNAATHRLTEEALWAWRGERPTPALAPATVAVAPGEAGAPLAGLRAALAVLVTGHRCRFAAPASSPALVPALLDAATPEAFEAARTLPAALAEADAAFGAGDAEARAAFAEACDRAGLSPARRCWRGAAFSVAVLDASEDEDAREGWAEDALLYEGHGRASVRLVWVPAGTAPDPYLDAMARFRAVFPAHTGTPGALQMQKAFLETRGQPHAHGDGLEFLVSRGAPEVQARGHVRWAEYDDLGEVRAWLKDHAASVHAVTARPALHERLYGVATPLRPHGAVHRQLLDAPGAGEGLNFTARL